MGAAPQAAGPARRILVTGCSGAGKSTLIDEMARRGWPTMAEPGRRVIAAEHAAGGTGFPWEDLPRFLTLCLETALEDWRAAGPGITLFDRGLLDAALGLRRLGQGGAAMEALAAHPYDPLVIVAAPWPALFANDDGRAHGLDEAQEEYDDIAASLPALGYRPETLPRLRVTARADWLETRLATG